LGHPITRRRALCGLLAGLAGGAACTWRSPPSAEERMRDDFASGEVYQVRGWFVSRTEMEALDLPQGRPVFPGEP
jgi:hypothetical protein